VKFFAEDAMLFIRLFYSAHYLIADFRRILLVEIFLMKILDFIKIGKQNNKQSFGWLSNHSKPTTSYNQLIDNHWIQQLILC
jgi:hypothetical protein